MNSGSSTIEIKKRRYSESTLCILLGLEDEESLAAFLKKQTIAEDILNIAWVIDKPIRLPATLGIIHGIKKDDNVEARLALARAQINAALRMNENLQMFNQQKFVAEAMERIIFGNLLVEGKSSKNSNNSNGNGKKDRKKGIKKKGTASSGKKASPKKKGTKASGLKSDSA